MELGRAQWWILIFLVGAVVIQIAANPAAMSALRLGQVVNAVQTVNGKLVLFVLVGFAGLELLSDAAPELAVGIAALLFVGALLTKGQQAFANGTVAPA